MPNTLSFSMEYRSRLSLLQIRAVFSMLCKSEIENDIDVKISVHVDINNFVGTVFHYIKFSAIKLPFLHHPKHASLILKTG